MWCIKIGDCFCGFSDCRINCNYFL